MIAHRALIGIFADVFSFLGASILARDAFLRLDDLQRKRIDRKFEELLPGLNLTDDELKKATRALRWALAGFALLVLGFFCQLCLRLAEK